MSTRPRVPPWIIHAALEFVHNPEVFGMDLLCQRHPWSGTQAAFSASIQFDTAFGALI